MRIEILKTILIALMTGGLVMDATTSMAQEIETAKGEVTSVKKEISSVSKNSIEKNYVPAEGPLVKKQKRDSNEEFGSRQMDGKQAEGGVSH